VYLLLPLFLQTITHFLQSIKSKNKSVSGIIENEVFTICFDLLSLSLSLSLSLTLSLCLSLSLSVCVRVPVFILQYLSLFLLFSHTCTNTTSLRSNALCTKGFDLFALNLYRGNKLIWIRSTVLLKVYFKMFSKIKIIKSC